MKIFLFQPVLIKSLIFTLLTLEYLTVSIVSLCPEAYIPLIVYLVSDILFTFLYIVMNICIWTVSTLRITVLSDLHWFFPSISIDKQGQPVSPSQFLSEKDHGPMLNVLTVWMIPMMAWNLFNANLLFKTDYHQQTQMYQFSIEIISKLDAFITEAPTAILIQISINQLYSFIYSNNLWNPHVPVIDNACHPGGHLWDYHPGALSSSQVTVTHMYIRHPPITLRDTSSSN